MPDANAAAVPAPSCQSGFLSLPSGILEVDLTRHGEHARVLEAVDERLHEIRFHAHVVIQQHHDVVTRQAETGIAGAAESEVGTQFDHAHGWEFVS